MIYVFHLVDEPGAQELRLRARPEHKAHLAQVTDRIAFAGPLTSEDDKMMIGSLLTIAFANGEEAEAWRAKESLARAGVYASASVLPFNLWPQRADFLRE